MLLDIRIHFVSQACLSLTKGARHSDVGLGNTKMCLGSMWWKLLVLRSVIPVAVIWLALFCLLISCLERPGDWGCEVESYFQAKKKWIFKLFIDTRPKVIDQILGKNKNAEVNVVNSSPIFHKSSHPNTGKLYFYQVMCVWSGDHFL